jgi:hypothetical protein
MEEIEFGHSFGTVEKQGRHSGKLILCVEPRRVSSATNPTMFASALAKLTRRYNVSRGVSSPEVAPKVEALRASGYDLPFHFVGGC